MKNTYVNNIPIKHGELTIVKARDAEGIMKHSSRLAHSVRGIGVNTLIINCGMAPRKFRKEYGFPEKGGGGKANILLMNSVKGDLVRCREEIDQCIVEAGISVIILSGWEWSSSGYRRKERLMFYLREIMDERDVAVVIYTLTTTNPKVGLIDRAGLGKLPTIAGEIVTLDTSEKMETDSPKPPPLVYTPDDDEKARRSAQLLMSKINNLEVEKGENVKLKMSKTRCGE